jgi:hypothetical protein
VPCEHISRLVAMCYTSSMGVETLNGGYTVNERMPGRSVIVVQPDGGHLEIIREAGRCAGAGLRAKGPMHPHDASVERWRERVFRRLSRK